jgi:hypothetical protein
VSCVCLPALNTFDMSILDNCKILKYGHFQKIFVFLILFQDGSFNLASAHVRKSERSELLRSKKNEKENTLVFLHFLN